MINIEDKTKCVGCTACADICPKSCIIMEKDSEGFYYPLINKKVCVHCSLCDKTCPIINSKKNEKEPVRVIGCYNKKTSILKKSSSGGVFYELAKYIIENKGIVYGVEYTSEKKARYKRVDSLSALDRIVGSKYIQAELKNTFKEIKKELDSNIQVLFSGTPCNVYALKLYLQKSYINLITVDFICIGVPSSKIFNQYLSQFEVKYNSKVVDVNFRKKKYGWLFFNIEIIFENGKVIHINRYQCDFIKIHHQLKILRPSCYSCKFRYLNSCSDIKLADFWKSKEAKEKIYNYNGVSHIVLSTIRGKDLFEKVSTKFIITESSYAEILKLNHSMLDLKEDINIRNQIMSYVSNNKEVKVCEYMKQSTKITMGNRILNTLRMVKTVIWGKYEK